MFILTLIKAKQTHLPKKTKFQTRCFYKPLKQNTQKLYFQACLYVVNI